jgi:hypothetical protein
MLRSAAILCAAVAAFSPLSAPAGEWFSWHTWKVHTHENIRWPEQYLDHDRAAARAPFAVMIANGWRSQNTISTYHFNEETGELNDTGRLKVRAVMRETPQEWRTLYVLRADTSTLTSARMKSVQQYAAELALEEPVPPMLITTVEPRGTRGDVSNRVNQQFMESAPAPVLPTTGREDAGGGS